MLAVSTLPRSSYHHGELRVALLTAAMNMLEAGEQFSLRAVAREAGVSPTAPYRHFEDRKALESALTAQGLSDLQEALLAGRDLPAHPSDLADFGVAYVEFALERPALFRLMFGSACDVDNPDRVAAANEIHSLVAAAVGSLFPRSDVDNLASALWGMAHGLAFLYLEGKLPADQPSDVSTGVRAAFDAIVAIAPA